jgi:hypothetical protein
MMIKIKRHVVFVSLFEKMNRLLIISILIVLTSCSRCNSSTQLGNSESQTDKPGVAPTKIEPMATNHKSWREENSPYFECTDIDKNQVKEQAASLAAFMEKAKNSDSINRKKWEQEFFCAFPDSFERMQAVFGSGKEASPLYGYPDGYSVIEFFSEMESIPYSIYYDKYVKINIDGVWEADNIQEAFFFDSRLLKDTKNACKILSKFSDSEIKSVFRFIFDGPYPKNERNKNLYEKLKFKVDSQDNRLGRLLTQAYSELISKSDE